METLPFATKPLQPSAWSSSNCTIDARSFKPKFNFQPNAQRIKLRNHGKEESSEEPIDHYEYMPAVLLNSLKRDKKPFTYTPGRFDLSEVLNEKLQKRLERKKKHLEDKFAPKCVPEELPQFQPPKQVLVMPTYNSPIDMYSMENALEALEVQAELAVSEKSLSPQRTQTLPRNYKYEATDFEPKNVTQSKAFRVLQIITDTDEHLNEKDENHATGHINEMTFKGTGGQQQSVPKYFHTLQKITGTDKEDGSDFETHDFKASLNNTEPLYIESKFTGIPKTNVIPSKYFQNLQRITGTEGSDSATASKHESRVHEDNIPQFQTETRFTGTSQSKAIPSKYFQNLQRITGTEESKDVNVQIHRNRGEFSSTPESNRNATSSQGIKSVSFQPKNFAINTSQTSIPVLQRPAAFLPATKKDSRKKKAACNVRFSAWDAVYNHGSNLRPYEGTDF